jgi:hypothetical protein
MRLLARSLPALGLLSFLALLCVGAYAYQSVISPPLECAKYKERGALAVQGCAKCAQHHPGNIEQCMDCGRAYVQNACMNDPDLLQHHEHPRGRRGSDEPFKPPGDRAVAQCVHENAFKEHHRLCMELRTKPALVSAHAEAATAESLESGDCYFDPECTGLVDWDGAGELLMATLARLQAMKSATEARPLAGRLRARLASLGVPEDRGDFIVTKWIKSVHPEYTPPKPDEEPPKLHLNGFYYTFLTWGNPKEVVDRFEGRTTGNLFTQYRNGPIGTIAWVDPATAFPMHSLEIRGTELLSSVGRATVERNGDIVWAHGYTSRKEHIVGDQVKKGELGDCYFDPECHKLVDWDGVGELKMGVFGRLSAMKNMTEAKPMAAGVRARLVELGVPEDRADFLVANWIKSVFKASLVYEPVEREDEAQPDIDGVYYVFKTGCNPAELKDRFEVRSRGSLATIYRSAPMGSLAPLDSAKAAPDVSFEIRGSELVGMLGGGIVQANGDIEWKAGYTARREPPATEARTTGALAGCYADAACRKRVEWERVGELKMRVFGGHLRTKKRVAAKKLMATGVKQGRVASFRAPDDHISAMVLTWLESVFDGYDPGRLAEPDLKLDGFYLTFQTGGSPKNVVDRFEQRRSGNRVIHYRNGPPGTVTFVDSATATPMESFEIRGQKLVARIPSPAHGTIEGTIQSNGDIQWSHGFTSRKESNRLFFVFFAIFVVLSLVLPVLQNWLYGLWPKVTAYFGSQYAPSDSDCIE